VVNTARAARSALFALLTLVREVFLGAFGSLGGADMGGELWESGRIAWSAGSDKTLRGLSCIYTAVHRYDVIKWRGKVKRFFEHPRMSERMRAKGGFGRSGRVDRDGGTRNWGCWTIAWTRKRGGTLIFSDPR